MTRADLSGGTSRFPARDPRASPRSVAIGLLLASQGPPGPGQFRRLPPTPRGGPPGVGGTWSPSQRPRTRRAVTLLRTSTQRRTGPVERPRCASATGTPTGFPCFNNPLVPRRVWSRPPPVGSAWVPPAAQSTASTRKMPRARPRLCLLPDLPRDRNGLCGRLVGGLLHPSPLYGARTPRRIRRSGGPGTRTSTRPRRRGTPRRASSVT